MEEQEDEEEEEEYKQERVRGFSIFLYKAVKARKEARELLSPLTSKTILSDNCLGERCTIIELMTTFCLPSRKRL